MGKKIKNTKDKYKYYSMSKKDLRHEKIVRLLPIICSVFFLLVGVITGIVLLYLIGWDFKKILEIPSLSLISILALIAGIVALGFVLFKKGNDGFDGQ